MVITPNKNAKQRTKNRVKEHGPEFELIDDMSSVQCMEGREAINVKASDGWVGWFPLNEVEVETGD